MKLIYFHFDELIDLFRFDFHKSNLFLVYPFSTSNIITIDRKIIVINDIINLYI